MRPSTVLQMVSAILRESLHATISIWQFWQFGEIASLSRKTGKPPWLF